MGERTPDQWQAEQQAAEAGRLPPPPRDRPDPDELDPRAALELEVELLTRKRNRTEWGTADHQQLTELLLDASRRLRQHDRG